jgi:hypothetical protein
VLAALDKQIKAAIAAQPPPPDTPDDVDEMSSEDWTEALDWMQASKASNAHLTALLEQYFRVKKAQEEKTA